MEGGQTNVEFRLLDFVRDIESVEPESFDFAFTQRGPIGYDSYGIQAALRVLKADGLLFCEMIGNLHQQEVAELFGPRQSRHQMIRTLDQGKVAMERNGVSIRLAAEIVTKQYYPNVYEWLQFQCSSGPGAVELFLRLTMFGSRSSRSGTRRRQVRSRPHTMSCG